MNETSSIRWVALTVLLLSYLLSVFHRVAIAMMADRLMEDVSMSVTQLGLLAAIYFYPYSFMQLPSGILADRLGPKRLVSYALFLAALASIAFGQSHSYPLILASRLLIGLSVSCIYVPTMKYAATFFPASMFSTLASLLSFAGVLGLLTATMPLAILVEVVGWRTGFLLIGIATGILAVAAWLLIAEIPEGRHNPADNSSDKCAGHESDPQSVFNSIKMVIREFGMWPISIRNHFNYGAIMSFQSIWAGPYLINIVGVSRVEAGTLIMLLSLGGLMSPLSGYLSDHIFKSRKKPVILISYCLVLFWIPFAFFNENLPIGLIAFLFLIYGFLNGLSMGPTLTMIKELYPNHLTGTAMGLTNFLTMSGPAVVPVIISATMSCYLPAGGVMTSDTFSVGFRCILAATVIAAIAVTFSRETYNSSIFKRRSVTEGSAAETASTIKVTAKDGMHDSGAEGK